MLKWFMNLTDKQINYFIDFRNRVYNRTLTEILNHDNIELNDVKYVFGVGFRLLAKWYEDCNYDRVLMLLRYADDIEEHNYIFSNEPDDKGPYPIELGEYLLNV